MIPNGLLMQDLIKKISAATGLETTKAEKAVGIMLGLVAAQGDKPKVDILFRKLPGARELAVIHGNERGGRGGFKNILASGTMGGPLAVITKLHGIGLSIEQIKLVGGLTVEYAKQEAGIETVRDAVANIPGLNNYL